MKHLGRTYGVGIVALVAILLALPIAAHHSQSAEYDKNKAFSLTGTVVRIAFNNPHVWLDVDVITKTGEVVHWKLEVGAPAYRLRSSGWLKDTLKVGDSVSVKGWTPRAPSPGEHRGLATEVIFAGKNLMPAEGLAESRP